MIISLPQKRLQGFGGLGTNTDQRYLALCPRWPEVKEKWHRRMYRKWKKLPCYPAYIEMQVRLERRSRQEAARLMMANEPSHLQLMILLLRMGRRFPRLCRCRKGGEKVQQEPNFRRIYSSCRRALMLGHYGQALASVL